MMQSLWPGSGNGVVLRGTRGSVFGMMFGRFLAHCLMGRGRSGKGYLAPGIELSRFLSSKQVSLTGIIMGTLPRQKEREREKG